jgi:hypothetical protein
MRQHVRFNHEEWMVSGQKTIFYWVNVLKIIMVIALVGYFKRLLVGGKWVPNEQNKWDSGKMNMIL